MNFKTMPPGVTAERLSEHVIWFDSTITHEIFSNTGLGQLAGASLEWSTDPVSSASPHTTVPEDR